jgi:hypothetical protein
MRALWLGLLWAVSLPCTAADDFKIIELEQDVIELERRVEALSREVDRLRERGTSYAVPPDGQSSCAEAETCPPRWLRAANWQRVRPGMGEFEVIDILGTPTSVRGSPEAQSRTLMYALEIGTSAFLSGQVQLTDRRVSDVRPPVLK